MKFVRKTQDAPSVSFLQTVNLDWREMKLILVIDRKNSRGRAMANSFLEVSECHCKLQTQAANSNLWIEEFFDKIDGKGEINEVSPFLVLRHFRDQEHLPKTGSPFDTIYYGGNGGSDRDAPDKKHMAIQRVVSSEIDKLTSVEVADILKFLGESALTQGDWPDVELWPEVLRPPRIIDTLVSLSILCQGYLGAFAMIKNRFGQHDSLSYVGRALIKMGWADVNEPKSITAGPKELKLSDSVSTLEMAEQFDLPNVEFWLAPFDLENTGSWETAVANLRKQLSEEIDGELPESVDQLLLEIKATISQGDKFTESDRNENRTVDPCTVAKAYLDFFSEMKEAIP